MDKKGTQLSRTDFLGKQQLGSILNRRESENEQEQGLYRPVSSQVGPWNPLAHRHWNFFPFGTQLPPFLHGAPAQGSGVLCEGGAAPKIKIQVNTNKYIYRTYFVDICLAVDGDNLQKTKEPMRRASYR